MTTVARVWFGLVTLVVGYALVLQFELVRYATYPALLEDRMIQFFSYFTILSNTLVLLTSTTLLLSPARDGRVWRVVRLSSLVGITITGLVHWFLLRPLLDLSGQDALADALLHIVVPVLSVVGWLVFGPRRRIGGATVLLGLVYPLVWLAYTFAMGAWRGWYPYFFLDPGSSTTGGIVIACVAILALMLVVSLPFWLGDRRLPAATGRTPLTTGPALVERPGLRPG